MVYKWEGRRTAKASSSLHPTTTKKDSSSTMSAPSPREAAIDALLRLLQAIDDNSPSLLASAVTSDTVLDMTGLSVVSGRPMPVLEGVQMATVGLLEHGPGNMDTGHVASSFQVEMKENGKLAELTAIAVAYHYKKGEGSVAGKAGLTVGNRYTMEVIEEATEGLWKIRKAEIKNLWCEGDLGVFAPGGPPQA